MGGQIALLLAGLVSVRALTELLAPEAYGRFALSLTLAQLIIQTLMGGLGQGFARFFSVAAEANELSSFLRTAAKLLAGATVATIGFGLLTLLAMNVAGHAGESGLFSLALAFAIFSGWNSTFGAIQNAARQRVIVVAHSSIDSWMRLFIAVYLIGILGASAQTVVIGYTISAIIICTSQVSILYATTYRRSLAMGALSERAQPHAFSGWAPQIWAFSWPFSAWGIFTWLQQASDRWALEIFSSTNDVGNYAALYQLGYGPVSMAAGVAMAIVAPILYERTGSASDPARSAAAHSMVRNLAGVILLGTFCGFLVLTQIHHWIFSLFVGEGFREKSFLLPWMFLAGGMFATGQLLSLKQMGDIEIRRLLAPKIATALIGLALNILGAIIAGIIGVVSAMVAFSVIYAVWMGCLSFRVSLPFVFEGRREP